jgi:hypothetical protein
VSSDISRKGGSRLNRKDTIKNWFSRTVEEELEDYIPDEERTTSIVLIVVCVLIMLYYVAHMMLSTGFFTATLGTLEILFLFGVPIFWIATSTLMLVERKNQSRDLDSYGGLIFATAGIAWLLVLFPFEFAYFTDVLPVFLRFLLQWISNDIARVLMVLLFIFHLVTAGFSLILRVHVHKARKRN